MNKLVSWGCILALASAWLGASSVVPAQAASFVVNSVADAVDASLGDGICQTATPGECTLRAAIQEANALSGDDFITLPASTYTLALGGAYEDATAFGDLDITSNITLSGASAQSTTIIGNGLDRVFHILNGMVRISNVTISGGTPVASAATPIPSPTPLSTRVGTLFGGGLLISGGSLTLDRVIVDGNKAEAGGGLYLAAGSASISFSTFSNNTATVSGGGGIEAASGSVSINNSTLTTNHATGPFAGAGGGLYVAAGASALVNNTTISNNTALGTDIVAGGGGLMAEGVVQLNSVTVANNTSALTFGNGLVQLGGVVNIRNSLIANNGTSPGTSSDCSGTLTSQGYNLLRVGTGCDGIVNNINGDQVGVDPLLDQLNGNNGLTQTQSLALPSPAIDAGNPAGCGDGNVNFTTDQRGPGFSRNQNSRCDIGAFEYIYQPNDPPTNTATITLTPSLTFTPSATASPTLTNTPQPSATQTASPTINASQSATPAPKVPLFSVIPPTAEVGLAQTAQRLLALTNTALPSTTPEAGQLVKTQTTGNVSSRQMPTITFPSDSAVLSMSASGIGRFANHFVCGLWMLEVPAGVWPENSHFRCSTVANDEGWMPELPDGVRGFWQTTDIEIVAGDGVAIETFARPLTLCAYYSDIYSAAVSSNPARFVIYTAKRGDKWQALSTRPDPSVRRVCAEVDHFSLFRLASLPDPAAKGGSVLSKLGSGLLSDIALTCGLLLLVLVNIVLIVMIRTRQLKEVQE